MTDSQPRTILNAKQAAEELGIDPDTLYKFTFDVNQPHLRRAYQTIPGYRIGKKLWRWNRESILAASNGAFAPPAPMVIPIKSRRSA